MHTQHTLTALELEIQSFAITLRRCFRDAHWEVVGYYAEHAWDASERSSTGWSAVEARVRTAWEFGSEIRPPKDHRVIATDLAPLQLQERALCSAPA